MIKSFKNSKSAKAVHGEKVNAFSGLDTQAAVEVAAILEAANSLDDIPPISSINLHPLKGNRKGQWAMTINGPWRLVFEWDNGNAYNVEVTNYHKG